MALAPAVNKEIRIPFHSLSLPFRLARESGHEDGGRGREGEEGEGVGRGRGDGQEREKGEEEEREE